jgi:hypothetical protein
VKLLISVSCASSNTIDYHLRKVHEHNVSVRLKIRFSISVLLELEYYKKPFPIWLQSKKVWLLCLAGSNLLYDVAILSCGIIFPLTF